MGCSVQNVSVNMEDSGFEVVKDTASLEKEVKDWINSKESYTGIYKNKFNSGNYLLVSLGNHKKYSIRRVDVQKDNYGYLFNITVSAAKSDHHSKEGMMLPLPILVKVENTNENYDIKIIYR